MRRYIQGRRVLALIWMVSMLGIIMPMSGMTQDAMSNEQVGAVEATEVIAQSVVVKPGDNFASILRKAKIKGAENRKIISAIQRVFNVRSLQVGTVVSFEWKETSSRRELQQIRWLHVDQEIIVQNKNAGKNAQASYHAFRQEQEKVTRSFYRHGVIASSLYQFAREQDMSFSVIQNLMSVLSYDVDFQRDIQKNMELSVLYHQGFSRDNKAIGQGHIDYVHLSGGDLDIELFYFDGAEDTSYAGYYTNDGRSVRKTLLKTPVDGAIISSHFGPRKHPILGYTKLHKGVDFAAPTGTAIYAAGDGRIVRKGKNGGYGHYIKIAHGGGYETAYAHLSRYKKGLKRHDKVRQGDIIGYVGNTGSSTGPHLHYEIIKNGVQVNPLRVSLPEGKALMGDKMVQFKVQQDKIWHAVDLSKIDR